MRQFTSHTRDTALRRLSRANRWLIAGSVALTGVLSEVAANAFAGKTLPEGTSGSRSSSKAAGTSSSTTTTPGPLQPPAHAPEGASATGSQESGSAQAPQTSESQSSQETPPSGEAAQSQQQAPAQESQAPVVSGGS
jgi:hypothetical protein